MTLNMNKRPAKTRGYQPLQTWWLRRHQKLPLLTFPIIEMMLCDETIQIGLAARRAVLQGVDFGYDKDGTWTPGVQCSNAMVSEWVMRQVKKLWSCAIEHIASAQVYGWAGMEVVWERSPETNLWEVSGVEERHANDVRAIIGGDTGRPCGVRFLKIKGAENGYLDLHFPESFFHAYNPNPGEWYGHTVLHGAYRPWADKHLDGGAVDVRRLFMHKDAYGGADLTYPEGSTDIGTLDNPLEVPNRELAREIVEQIEAGGVTTTPAQYDDRGNPLWKLTRAVVPSNPSHILQYPGDLDGEMLRGIFVPDGVLKADDTGSWQGRLIPMGILYANLDPWVGSILRDIREQILEPGILNNWGQAIPFVLEHQPLADQALEQQKQQQPAGPGGGPEDLMGMLGGGPEGDNPIDPTDPEGQDDDPENDDDDKDPKFPPKRMALDPVAAVGEGVLSAAGIVAAARAALRMGPTEDEDEDEDPRERAEQIADILSHVFGDEAEAYFNETFGDDAPKRMASWNSIDHPRGANGRFIPKNSPEAVAAAKDSIKEALSAPRTTESAKKLTEHLSILNTKQLADLKKEYGIAAGSKTKASLVDKIADRLDRGRRDPKPEEPQDAPKDESPKDEQAKADPEPTPAKKDKKPFVYPNGETQAFNTDGSPATGSEAMSQAEDAGADPREAAEAADNQEDTKQEYEFARDSEIGNRGEDLKNSARHKVNAWKGLADAEADGTAEKLVNRDMLLKLEPHNMMTHADKNPLTALAMHFALKAFPPTPVYGKSGKNTPESRQAYLEAYRSVKAKAEEIAATYADSRSVNGIEELKRYVSKLIDERRKVSRYDMTANNLVSLHNALIVSFRPSKTGAYSRLNEFSSNLKDKYGDEWLNAIKDGSSIEAKQKVVDLASQHAMDVIEGKSLNAAFGKEGTGATRKKGFVLQNYYGQKASRTGGKDLSDVTADANKAVDHLIDEYGLRGVQWGNSVTDEERKHHAGRVVEAIADLADITGLHPRDISLDGKLGLAIGARGHGGAMAHYEPGNQVINLTRSNGVGTLAHEWGHAFDHMLMGFGTSLEGGKYMSEVDGNHTHEVTHKTRGYPLRVNAATAEAYRTRGDDEFEVKELPDTEIRGAMASWKEAAKPFMKRVKGVVSKMVSDGELPKSKRDYWNSALECFARSFEVHVKKQLEKKGRENTYLSSLSDDSGEGSLWPTDSEAEAMAEAFGNLMTAYRKKRHGQTEPIKFSLVDVFTAMGLPVPQEDNDAGPEVQEDESEEQAEAIAEVLQGVYGDQAEAMFDQIYGAQRMASWNSIDHPRGPNGRFISRNSPEAAAAAKSKVAEALKGARTPSSLKTVTEHLSILTVKQLREVQKEHGIKAGGAKPELVKKIADRLHGAVGQTDEEANPDREDGTPKAPTASNVHTVPTSSLQVDPKRFQYKVKDIGEDGVTGELKGVSKWNPELAGTLLAWRDPKTGQDFVVNGHHRHELAKRLGADKLNVRYIDAENEVEARARGALANIAEGRGSAIDAAKYLNDSGQSLGHLRDAGISLSGKVAADALVLKDLGPKPFQLVTEGRLEEGKALAVAKHLKDASLQEQLFRRLSDREDQGKDWSNREIETAAKKMASAGKYTEQGQDLFGMFEDEHSTFDQEVELESHVSRMLQQESNDFRAVANKRRADRVSDAGNVLAIDENAKRANAAEGSVIDFEREARLRGPVSQTIQHYAAKLAKSKTRAEKDAIRGEVLGAVRTVLSGLNKGA